MTVLVSNILNGTVTGAESITIFRPSIPELILIGDVVALTRGTYREGNGTFEQRWGTLESGLIGATGTSYTVTGQQEGQTLYVEERTFNTSGYPLRWVRSNVVAVLTSTPEEPATWLVDGSVILSHPDAPDAPSVNGTLVTA